jgi:hypothetical protein
MLRDLAELASLALFIFAVNFIGHLLMGAA